MIPRARVLSNLPKAEHHGAQRTRAEPALGFRRVPGEVLDAKEEAAALLAEARVKAELLVSEAAQAAAHSLAEARAVASSEARTELAAQWLILRETEQRALGGERDRVVTLGVALAERLLKASLALSPERIVDLAQAVIAEARGARRAVVEASPDDLPTLHRNLTDAGMGLDSFELREDRTLARGELRLHTDVGTIDARLAPRFERLVAAVRDALR